MIERPQPRSGNHDRRTASLGQATLRRHPLGGYRYVRWRWRLLFALVDTLGTTLFAAAGCLVALWRRIVPARRGKSETTRRILVVQLDHLGDAIITAPIFALLKQRYPGARIEVLAAPWNRRVFDLIAEVDRVHVCSKNRFAPRPGLSWIPAVIAWGLRMRRRRFDLAIDVRGEFPHNVLLWLCGARRRVGWGSGGGGFLLTDRAAYVSDRPELESRMALLERLGIDAGPAGRRPLPRIHPPEEANDFARSAWRQASPERSVHRVVIHVGAGTAAKRWPVEHWRVLLAGLAARGGVAVALVGAESDTATARAILGSRPWPVVDWTGRLEIAELAAVLQQADLAIGADSGPAHLAAAVGTPVVVLFSGTNRVEQWRPQGAMVQALRHPVACAPCHRRQCPVASQPCMRGIRPADVLLAIEELLAAAAGRGEDRSALVPAKRGAEQ